MVCGRKKWPECALVSFYLAAGNDGPSAPWPPQHLGLSV